MYSVVFHLYVCLCVCLPRTCSTIYSFFFRYSSGFWVHDDQMDCMFCPLSAECIATITIIHTNDSVNRTEKENWRERKNGHRIRWAVDGLVYNSASNCNKSFAEIVRVFWHFELSPSILALTSLCLYSWKWHSNYSYPDPVAFIILCTLELVNSSFQWCNHGSMLLNQNSFEIECLIIIIINILFLRWHQCNALDAFNFLSLIHAKHLCINWWAKCAVPKYSLHEIYCNILPEFIEQQLLHFIIAINYRVSVMPRPPTGIRVDETIRVTHTRSFICSSSVLFQNAAENAS